MKLASLAIGLTLIYSQAAFGAVVAPNLGSAGSFGLLWTISNTGTSVVVGNVGAITTDYWLSSRHIDWNHVPGAESGGYRRLCRFPERIYDGI